MSTTTSSPATGHPSSAAAPKPGALADAPVTIQYIPLAQLRESPCNARKYFDKEKLQELADSIRAKGVLTPLLVRPRHDADTTPERYEILAGARRFRAAQIASQNAVPCVVREVDNATALEIMTIENLQREDLSALEEAAGFKALLDLGKYDVAALAKRLGKSQSYVYQRVKLVELAPEAKKALVDQKISAGHAILIARLQPQDQRRALEQAAGDDFDGPASVRDLGEWIQREVHLDLARAPWSQADAQLVPKAGACTVCPKREKNACLDPACYEAKMRAHFRQVEKSVDSRLVKISAEYEPEQKDVLGYRSWRFANAQSCPNATVGLVIEGGSANDRDLKRGQQVGVCVDTKCKIHWTERGSSSSGYKRPAAELARERKRKAELARRARLFGVLAQQPYQPTDAERRAIAEWMARRLDHDQAKRLCDALQWPPATASYGGKDYGKAVRNHLKAMKIAEIERWMVWLLIAAVDLYVAPYESMGRTVLLDACAKRAHVKAPAAGKPAPIPKKKAAAKSRVTKTARRKS